MTFDFENCAPGDWIGALPAVHAKTIDAMLTEGMSLEDIGQNWLSRVGPENTFPFGAGSASHNFFGRVMDEIRKFVCGDPSYKDLRKKIENLTKKHKTEVVGAIAAGIGAVVGLSAVVLVPVVGIALAIICKIGVNAYCAAPATTSDKSGG
jgi:hypothetical protein